MPFAFFLAFFGFAADPADSAGREADAKFFDADAGFSSHDEVAEFVCSNQKGEDEQAEDDTQKYIHMFILSQAT